MIEQAHPSLKSFVVACLIVEAAIYFGSLILAGYIGLAAGASECASLVESSHGPR